MLTRIARALGGLLEWVLIALMLGLTIVVVLAVVYRKLGASFSWYDEIASIMLAWITYYGAALAALRRRHIGFDGLLLALPPQVRLAGVVVAEILVIAFFALLAWAGWKVLSVVGGDTLISLTWVPLRVTQSVIPIGAVLFIVAELLSLPAYWRSVRTGQTFEHPEFEPAGGVGR